MVVRFACFPLGIAPLKFGLRENIAAPPKNHRSQLVRDLAKSLSRNYLKSPFENYRNSCPRIAETHSQSRFSARATWWRIFGLAPRRWQSGSSIDVKRRISKAGGGDVRRAPYEAGSVLLTRYKRQDTSRRGAGDRQAVVAPRSQDRDGAQACPGRTCDVSRWHVLPRRSGGIHDGIQAASSRRARSQPNDSNVALDSDLGPKWLRELL